MMRTLKHGAWILACSLGAAYAQSTAPVLIRSLSAQSLAPGGAAVTIDLRNYFAVPGLPSGEAPAPYATVFPTGGGSALLTLAAENSAPAVVEAFLSGSTLTLTPLAPGRATIVVRATDPAGVTAAGEIAVSVAADAPAFTLQPRGQRIAAGTTVVFSAPAVGAASYQWTRDGAPLPAETTSTLVIANVSSADAGRYAVEAVNAIGRRTSDSALLEVVVAAPGDVGRLTNLSILTRAGGGDQVLTMGAVVGPFGATGAVPLVIRAVGPTLARAPFNVTDALGDPVMTLFAAGVSSPLETNDNWGGSETMRAAFDSVAAFSLEPASLDSAVVRPAPGVGVGGYTVQVAGRGTADGLVLAEVYDASGPGRDPDRPRLINLSTLSRVDAGSDLTAGFVIAGRTARTVLVRGVGPSLAPLGVSDVMANPRLELYDNATGQRIAANEDWDGALEISNAGAAVGAFPLGGGTSQDAALVVTLPAGPYSARLTGGASGGWAIVEVYEVP